jgi:hypothetical protein
VNAALTVTTLQMLLLVHNKVAPSLTASTTLLARCCSHTRCALQQVHIAIGVTCCNGNVLLATVLPAVGSQRGQSLFWDQYGRHSWESSSIAVRIHGLSLYLEKYFNLYWMSQYRCITSEVRNKVQQYCERCSSSAAPVFVQPLCIYTISNVQQ